MPHVFILKAGLTCQYCPLEAGFGFVRTASLRLRLFLVFMSCKNRQSKESQLILNGMKSKSNCGCLSSSCLRRFFQLALPHALP